MLEIFVSRNNNAVEEKIFQEGMDAFLNKESVYLLVPEQYTLQNEINLMNHLTQKAVSKIKVMSFQRLALEALSKLGGIKRPYIDAIGKTMALKSVLQQNKQHLSSGSSIDKEGFVEGLLRQIAELKRGMITPTMLQELSEKKELSDSLSQKLRELALIYQSLDQYLLGKYVDNEDRLGQVAELGQLPYLKGKRIYIYSFLDFTAIELQITRNLLQSGAYVRVGLCLDVESTRRKEETVFSPTMRTLEQLTKISQELGIATDIKPLEEVDLQNITAQEDIAFLGDNIFQVLPMQKAGKPIGISLYGAHSMDEEIRQIALDISKKVVKEGYRYKDFMVVSGSLGSYSTSVKQVFGQFGIPFFIDEKRSIIASPIVKTVIAILQILDKGFLVEDLMVFLKNSFSTFTSHEIYSFENFMIQRNFKGKMFMKDKYFFQKEELESPNETVETKTKEAKEASDREITIQVRERLLDLFVPTMNQLEKAQLPKEYNQILLDLFVKMELEQKIKSFVGRLQGESLLDDANANSQIWNVLIHIMNQGEKIFGEIPMAFGEYKGLLIEAIKSHQLAVTPPAKDQVIVGSVDRSRSDSKQVTYLCGATSDSIPRSYKESSFLTSEEKTQMMREGLMLPSELSLVDANEQLMLYIMLTRGTRELHISYATEGGKLPSTLIGQIQEIFPQLELKNKRSFEASHFVSFPKPTVDYMAQELKGYRGGKEKDPLWLDALAYYKNQDEIRTMVDSALAGIFYTNWRALISSAKELYKPYRFSTTRIQNYDACPFKHFVKYGLRAKERKEYAIAPAEMGQVIHKTLEKLVKGLREESIPLIEITQEKTEQLVDSYFDESAQELLKEYDLSESRNQFVLQGLKKTARRVSHISVENFQQGKFKPIAEEIDFGKDSLIPEIVLEMDGETIVLTGTIDRIDVLEEDGETYVQVVDYKTSDKKFSLADAYNGIDIQLVVYMTAALNKNKLISSPAHPGGMFYFPIFNPMKDTSEPGKGDFEEVLRKAMRMKGLVLKEAKVIRGLDPREGNRVYERKRNDNNLMTEIEFELLMDHVKNNIKQSVQEMLAGNISVSPISKKDWNACTYCRYGSICRFEVALGDQYKTLWEGKDEQIKERLAAECGSKEQDESATSLQQGEEEKDENELDSRATTSHRHKG